MDKKECKKVDEKNEYQKIEGKLYNYYRYKGEVARIKNTIESIEKQITEIDNRIKNAYKYVTLDTDLPAQGFEERVQNSSDGTSYFERQLEREVTSLQKEKLDKIKRIYKMDSKVRNMENLIHEMDYNLSLLNEEERKIVELKYKSKKSIAAISMEMNISLTTTYRRKDKIISNLYT